MVGIPSGDRICAITTMCLMALMVASKNLVTDFQNVRGSYLDHTHNDLVKLALADPRVEHLLFIDSDMVFPPDALVRLLAHDKDFVGCTYRKRGSPHDLMWYPLNDSMSDLENVTKTDGLREWRALPSGLILVRMKVFREIGFPWFFNTYGELGADTEFVSTDINLCNEWRMAGGKLFCDLDLSQAIAHLAEVPLTFRV